MLILHPGMGPLISTCIRRSQLKHSKSFPASTTFPIQGLQRPTHVLFIAVHGHLYLHWEGRCSQRQGAPLSLINKVIYH